MVHSSTKHQSPPPLHKTLFFRILVGLVVLFFILSLLLYTKLEDIEGDDDLIMGSGGGDGLREGLVKQSKVHFQRFQQWRRRRRKRKKSKQGKEEDGGTNKNDDDDDDNQVDERQRAINTFGKDQEDAKHSRMEQGKLSPREKFEQQQQQQQISDDLDDWKRIQSVVEKLRQPELATKSDDVPYNIRDCPLDPPLNYPFSWNVMQVLENWGPDDTELPVQLQQQEKEEEETDKQQQQLKSNIHQSLCIFDWTNDKDQMKAENYRQKELPFVVQNFPEAMKAAERWMTPGYLEELLGDEKVFNEHSRNNHFMYWKTKQPKSDYVPPTDSIDLTYREWLDKAQHVQQARRQAQEEHWYFRLNAAFGIHSYLYEELPMFDPSKGKSFTVVNPKEHRGINCRFGMKGVIAEAHYDAHNNFIALMGGQRRYILAHPSQCENMELYPLRHPSARHSRVNWSTAAINWRDSDRPFARAQVNEVVLQAGDLMYLPTYWFHFIVSLNINYQCNSRSGGSQENQHFISKCGFGPRKEYDRKTIRGATG